MKKKLLAALLATAMTVTMFAGCGTPGSKDSKKDDSSASSGKKRITYTLREDLPSMDPQNSNSISCATAEICTYAMLTRNVEGEIKPDAAESWDISDDGLTYTFHLRDGLKWSDGEDVKAGDYVYGIQRLMDPEMASDYAFIGYILKNGAEVNSGSVPVDELGVSAPDDKTVVIELAHPATYFLSMAAMATFGPTRKDYVEKYGKEYAADPEKSVYNGPFKMTEWKHGDEMILSKNENYWDADSIKLDEICVKTVADAKTAVAMWEQGEETSTNSVATIFAWTGALRKRGELDGNQELMDFADRLEKATIDTIEEGYMTKDLAMITTLPEVHVLNSEGFIKAIAERL